MEKFEFESYYTSLKYNQFLVQTYSVHAGVKFCRTFEMQKTDCTLQWK